MSVFLASDDRNPNFLGAHNPDSRLTVQFYERPVLQEFKSKEAQRPIYETTVYVKIIAPGESGRLSSIDTIANDQHKNRFPLQWAAFKNREGAEGQIVGTPITEWPRINRTQAEELKALKFFTVESIAGASDAQLQGVGMIAGASAFTFRDDAKRFLLVADAAAKMQEADQKAKEADEKLEAAKNEILRQSEQHAKDMEEMRAQMKMMMAAMNDKKGVKPAKHEDLA